MKKIEKMLLCAAWAFACISCSNLVPEKMIEAGDASLVSLHVYPQPSADTRSAYEFGDMDRISNINVLLYYNGELCQESSCYFSGSDVVVSLPDPGAAYDVFILANMGDIRKTVADNCPRVEDIMEWVYDIGDYSLLSSYGLPMAAYSLGWKRTMSADFALKRLMCRIDIRIRNSSEYNLQIHSMALKHAPRKLRPFKEGYFAVKPEDVIALDEQCDYLSPEDIAYAVENEGVVHLYCAENMQGNLLPENIDPKGKNLDAIPEGRRGVVTYFEISASMANPAVEWSDVHYRFCLGMDITSNFDIPRNRILSYSLDFANSPENTGWTIDAGTPVYTPLIKVVPALSEFNNAWDKYSFDEVSVLDPVTVVVNGVGYVVDGTRQFPETIDEAVLDAAVLVLGSDMYIRNNGGYAMAMMQEGRLTVEKEVPSGGREVSWGLTAKNAACEDVSVRYIPASDSCVFQLGAFTPEGEVAPWNEVFLPEDAVALFDESELNAMCEDKFDLSLYFSDAQGAFDSGEVFCADSVRCGCNDPGRPTVFVSAPSSAGYLWSSCSFFGVSADMESRVFDPEDYPVLKTSPLLEVDNNAGDMYAAVHDGVRVLPVVDAAFDSPLRYITRSEGHSGEMDVKIDAHSGTMTLEMSDLCCGHAGVSFLEWDYDTAPVGWVSRPMDIYLDLTFVPKLGIMFNEGTYFGTKGFKARNQLSQIFSSWWGYQFVTARRESYIKIKHVPESDAEIFLYKAAQRAPMVVSDSSSPEAPTSGYVGWYNAGNVLNNPAEASPESKMPNGGTVFFLKPYLGGTWYVTIDSILEYNSVVWESRYLTAYPDDVAKYALNVIPSTIRYNAKFFDEVNDRVTTDLMHKDMGDGILVNYHIRCDTCLEMLMNDWIEY